MPLGMEVGLGPGHFGFDGDPARPGEKGYTHSHPSLAHVYCGQMAGWMKTPLGTEVDLVTRHIVLDRAPALHEGGRVAPSFRPMSIVATVADLSYC